MRLFKTMSIVFFLMTFAQSSLVQADTIFVDAVAQADEETWGAKGTHTPAPSASSLRNAGEGRGKPLSQNAMMAGVVLPSGSVREPYTTRPTGPHVP